MPITPVAVDSPEGKKLLKTLYTRGENIDSGCREAVTAIIKEVRERGDHALTDYTKKFDCPDMTREDLRVTGAEIDRAVAACDPGFLQTLRLASDRIRDFHQEDRQKSWFTTREDGVVTGRLVRPVDAAGLYVPGGQGGSTPLVSSVLMNGLPARIAGVKRLVMMTPAAADRSVHPALLAAAREVGISEIYKCGSAWAIAALAYGTCTIDPVDVIVGPGNRYVTEAKRQVAGVVGIDMIAGPSEVLVVADHTAVPAAVAADMLAQAEHDPEALAMAIVTTHDLADAVARELKMQVEQLPRQEIARKSLAERGVLLVCPDMDQAMEIANRIGAEHLELMVADPWERLTAVRHAGAVFLGPHTPEAAGDYIAGPNHVLPTMGTARFSSSLGVETFLKKSSVIAYSRKGLLHDAEHILRLAELEGLTGHANSVRVRT